MMQLFNITCIINITFLYLFLVNSHADKTIYDLQSATSIITRKNKFYYKYDTNIVKQSIIQGNLISYRVAKIRLLDYNLGVNFYLKLFINEEFRYNNDIVIILQKCKKDSQNILNPLNMALIFIKRNNQLFYNDWIFSQNSAFALPKIDNKFIYLTSCEN